MCWYMISIICLVCQIDIDRFKFGYQLDKNGQIFLPMAVSHPVLIASLDSGQ